MKNNGLSGPVFAKRRLFGIFGVLIPEKMKGIRKKINTGFLVLIVLLVFSGIVSVLELDRLDRGTQALLRSNYYNLGLSKRMLDAAELQNGLLLRSIVMPSPGYDTAYATAGREFDAALREAAAAGQAQTEIDSIASAYLRYRELAAMRPGIRRDSGPYGGTTAKTAVIDIFTDHTAVDNGAVAGNETARFLDIYKNSYDRLTATIKEYMVNSQHSLVSHASQFENNAYRAITPGIITLAVAIIIVLVFMFMIDFYYTRPLTKLKKGLDGYLKYNIPFRVREGGSDEIAELKDSIEGLISATRKKQ